MYTLFVAPNSYAMTVHAMLEDMGVEYDLKWVTLFTGSPDPELKAISPHCRVPALRYPGGALCETGAIAWFLAEQFPESGMLVASDDPQRGQFLQWFHYLATTLQPEVMLQFHPESYFTDSERQGDLKLASMQRLCKVLSIIENTLSKGGFFMGKKRTLLDYLFALQAVWPEIYPTSIEDYPCISGLVDEMTARSAVSDVIRLHEGRRNEKIWPL